MTALSLTLLCKMKVSHGVFQWNFFFFAQARGSDGKLMASYSRGLKAVLSHDKKLIIKYMIGPEEGS